MSRKTRKRGRRRLLVIVVLLALIVFGVFARGLLTSGKTTAERAQRELDSYAEKNDASLDDYPDALVKLYARNPDARDFVRDYPKKKDLTPTIDLSGLAGSETVPLPKYMGPVRLAARAANQFFASSISFSSACFCSSSES